MKNTKKALAYNITMAIVLFASSQIFAMQRQVNPQLSPSNKRLLETKIKEMGTYLNPKYNRPLSIL
ncbi:MAG TPA: hypothetical protein VJ201_02415 [Candidatus Babeliales bacterium]|nr:hypothetical protein [Candidatus Babeliales bacterium]